MSTHTHTHTHADNWWWNCNSFGGTRRKWDTNWYCANEKCILQFMRRYLHSRWIIKTIINYRISFCCQEARQWAKIYHTALSTHAYALTFGRLQLTTVARIILWGGWGKWLKYCVLNLSFDAFANASHKKFSRWIFVVCCQFSRETHQF